MKYLLLFILILNINFINSIEIIVSASIGVDVEGCGQSIDGPCLTIPFAIERFNEIFQLSNETSRTGFNETYPNLLLTLDAGTYELVNASINIWKFDLILEGIEGKEVVLTAKKTSFFKVEAVDFGANNLAHTYLTLNNINVAYGNVEDSVLLLYRSDDTFTLAIKNSTISNNVGTINSVISFDSKEGRVYSIVTISIESSIFASNFGESGILFSGLPTSLTITNSTFSNNSVTVSSRYVDSPVFLLADRSYLHISNSNFYFNSGTIDGVFTVFNQNSTYISNSYFSENTGHSSGVATITGGSLFIEKSAFDGNKGDGKTYNGFEGGGGGVFLLSLDSAQFLLTNFTSNYAKLNGGVLVTKSGEYSFYDTIISDNSAFHRATTVFCYQNSTFYFESSNTITQNSQYGDRQVFEGFDCYTLQPSQTCHFFGDAETISSITNNYNCTVGPWVPVIQQDYIYGVPKGAFAAIAIGLVFIALTTFFIIRYIIRKQMLHLQQFGGGSNNILTQRLIN